MVTLKKLVRVLQDFLFLAESGRLEEDVGYGLTNRTQIALQCILTWSKAWSLTPRDNLPSDSQSHFPIHVTM